MQRRGQNTKSQGGFTIVEILVVVVVIAIIAAIVVIAYSGVQTRASATKSIADLAELNKIVKLYHAEHGVYPSSASTWVWSNQDPTNYVPEVVPSVTQSLPVTSGSRNGSVQNNTYGYRSDGNNYKLMAHADDLCEEVLKQRPDMVASTARRGPPCWAYGFWSPAAENW